MTLRLACLADSAPKVYVDESLDAASLPSEPTGTQSSPYVSSVSAFLAQGPLVSLYVKKAPSATATADEPKPDFEPISSSGLKKAKKLYEAEKKKLDKAAAGKEKADRDAEEARKREELKREEAAKIVLVEDASLPKATKARTLVTLLVLGCSADGSPLFVFRCHIQTKLASLVDYRDKRVRVFGWVHRLRQQKDLTFITLRDGSGLLQVVLGGLLVRVVLTGSTHQRQGTNSDFSLCPLVVCRPRRSTRSTSTSRPRSRSSEPSSSSPRAPTLLEDTSSLPTGGRSSELLPEERRLSPTGSPPCVRPPPHKLSRCGMTDAFLDLLSNRTLPPSTLPTTDTSSSEERPPRPS